MREFIIFGKFDLSKFCWIIHKELHKELDLKSQILFKNQATVFKTDETSLNQKERLRKQLLICKTTF